MRVLVVVVDVADRKTVVHEALLVLRGMVVVVVMIVVVAVEVVRRRCRM